MPRGPKHFYRLCAPDTLQALFGLAGEEGVPFLPEMTDKEKAALANQTANDLSAARRGKLYALFAEIDALANDLGVQALLEAAGRSEEAVARFAAMRADEERAAWMRVHQPDAFEEAGALRFYDAHSEAGHWASAFELPAEAKSLADDLAALQTWFAQRAVEEFGEGPHVRIETFDVGDGRTLLSVHYEGFWTAKPAFQADGALGSSASPMVHYAAIMIEQGGLTVVSDRGGPRGRAAIAHAVAKHALGLEGELARLPLAEYNLQRLLDPAPFATDPAHLMDPPIVTRLELRSPSWGSIVKINKSSGRDPEDVRRQAMMDVPPAERDLVRVIGGWMRVQFREGGARKRPRCVSIKFSGRNSCRIHPGGRNEDELVRGHYIKRWGLLRPLRERQARDR
ncbi:MAG: hypothetical protein AB7J28_01715 [Hyphomonadaceae bacterium]